MKKVIVVSKTHLDLGFTDYAKNVRDAYLSTYIPNAVALAKELNTPQKKQFIWTTGSWILKEALENGTAGQKENLKQALLCGNIVPHAMPFTTHTELLDEDTLEYGFSIVHRLDALRGRKTIAAKMTDVPGHTKAIVPLLQKHGVKLLHIGVNGASALAAVPPCFLWKCGDAEVVVLYSGDYGGAFQCDLIEEILYFDHTLDNRGTPSAAQIEKKLQTIGSQYPGYTVEAGTMDEIALLLWEKRNCLPVLTGEIGDTWIHGSATDPYKSAALRQLAQLKNQWLTDGTMVRNSEEHRQVCDALLCIAEHTCGMDMKKFFADYEHYLKKEFQTARQADQVKIRHPMRDFPQNLFTLFARASGEYHRGSYRVAETSWAEQRDYIQTAVCALSPSHKAQAEAALKRLVPQEPMVHGETFDLHTTVTRGSWSLQFNEYGAIASLHCNGQEVIRPNRTPLLEYRSFDKKDYDFWLAHYSRNLKKNSSWAYGDFGRPLLKYAAGKYPVGRFAYQVIRASILQSTQAQCSVCLDLVCRKQLCEELGAPRLAQVVYRLTEKGLSFTVSWFGKDANRLPEALYLHLFPSSGKLRLRKIKEWIDPYAVVSMGGRKLHAVQSIRLSKGSESYYFVNRHSPVVSLGSGKILEFDNTFESVARDGITYVLSNNVWGTNFPLWYEDNAMFGFEITQDL